MTAEERDRAQKRAFSVYQSIEQQLARLRELPPTRELSLALTKGEECLHWLNDYWSLGAAPRGYAEAE